MLSLGSPDPESIPVKPIEGIISEARCDCGKLLGRNVNFGIVLWCSRCKKETTFGKGNLLLKSRHRLVRSPDGLISSIEEEVQG